jgi:proteasome lid subunit RPN8/RPN11
MFDASIIAAATAHAKRDYPKEAGGLVIDGRYVAFPNVAKRPREFLLPDDAWPLDRTVDAVIHSHVAPADPLRQVDPRAPSAADIAGQLATGVPWGIIWTDGKRATEPIWFGDHLLSEPLFDANGAHIQRPFTHGVRDCLTLARAWFYQRRGVTIRDVPRDVEFWRRGEDLFGDNLAAHGFARIRKEEIGLEGDVVLMRTARSVDFPHHCGVLLAERQLLHHPRRGLSISEPLGRWEAYVLYGARYQGTAAAT